MIVSAFAILLVAAPSRAGRAAGRRAGRTARPEEPAAAAPAAAERDAAGDGALHARPGDARRQLLRRRRAAAAGRGARQAAPAVQPEPLSPGRIARLERFDLDWQAALAALDPAALSPAARDRARDAEGHGPVEPEAGRRRVARRSPRSRRSFRSRRRSSASSKRASGWRTSTRRRRPARSPQVTAEIGRVRARLEAGLAGGAGARRAAGGQGRGRARRRPRWTRCGPASPSGSRSTTATTRCSPGGGPAVQEGGRGARRATRQFLREKVVPADGASPTAPAARRAPIAPAPAPKFASVPDLKELIALPQDEMTDIVQRFRGAGGRGGRGGDGAAPGAGRPARDRAFYEDWLKALKTLDFDKLSRNAQVDYLSIKKMAEQQIARDRRRAPREPAAQGRRVGHPRQGARPAGPHLRPAGRADPLHARGADRVWRGGVRVVRGRDEEGVAPARARRRLEGRAREDEGDPPAAGRAGRRRSAT